MELFLGLVILTVALALLFDYTNGFHDTSTIVATMIASGAMSPRNAIVLAGVFHFLGPMLGGTAVANTIGKLVDLERLTQEMGRHVFEVQVRQDQAGQKSWRVQDQRTREIQTFANETDVVNFLASQPIDKAVRWGQRLILLITMAALLGATFWNLFTWYFGLPSSSSHALVGGLVGATLVATRNVGTIQWGSEDFNLLHPHGVIGVLVALVASPLIGFLLGFSVQRVALFALRWATPRANVWLSRWQWLSSGALAFSHGTNDAQISMGVITLVLVASGSLAEFQVPLWVKFACALAITLGTVSGGWRIMKTIGRGLFRLRPIHGFSSQFASAAVILGHALIGGPVSTTHVVSSTVMGVGSAERKKAVRWGKVKEILVTWVLTVPAAALAAALFYAGLSPLTRWL